MKSETKQKQKKREKHQPKWMRTEHKKMTSSFFFISFDFECCCICINVCHMRVIKWAHGVFFSCVFVCVFVFSFIPATLSYNLYFNSFDLTKESLIRWSRLKCRILLRLRTFYVCMPYNLCECLNRLWNRFYSSNGL